MVSAPAAARPEWSRPTAPFHIAGPIYYVGTEGIAVYLIETADGLILLDAGPADSVPAVEKSIVELGFRLTDVKQMIATHAHWDHAAGLAQLKADTGARFAASPGDSRAYETGMPAGQNSGGVVPFPPVKLDGLLVDGRPIRLGGVAITPVFTPGHTPGCTSWRMQITEPAADPGTSRRLDVVFPCSITVAGEPLVGNTAYPGIVADFRRTFAKVRALPADIVLTAHPEASDVLGRAKRRDAGDKDAFLAPGLLRELADESEAGFEEELKLEAAPKPEESKPPEPQPQEPKS